MRAAEKRLPEKKLSEKRQYAPKKVNLNKQNLPQTVRLNSGGLFYDRNILWFNSDRAKKGGFLFKKVKKLFKIA